VILSKLGQLLSRECALLRVRLFDKSNQFKSLARRRGQCKPAPHGSPGGKPDMSTIRVLRVRACNQNQGGRRAV